jgi:hypothetical protein
MNPHISPIAYLCPKNPTRLPYTPLAVLLQPCPTPITKPLACPTLSFMWEPGRTSLLALIPTLAQTPSTRNRIFCLTRVKPSHPLPRKHRRPRKHHRPRRPKGPRHSLKRAPTPSQACPPGSTNTMRVHGLRTKTAPVSTRRAQYLPFQACWSQHPH